MSSALPFILRLCRFDLILESIIFRAFQDIGACGIYTMTMVIAPGLVSAEKFGKYMALFSSAFFSLEVSGLQSRTLLYQVL